MKFERMTFEVSGIKEVRIEGELYTRTEGKHTTTGGKIVTNKYFRREKDGHMIHEHKFIAKMHRMATEQQFQNAPSYTLVDNFGNVKTESRGGDWVNVWRFEFSGTTINIRRILI